METKKASKGRSSFFTSTTSKYGTYEGPKGSREEWRSAFEEVWTHKSASEVTKDDNPWSILGISANSSVDIIKSAFRKLMMIHHPDVGGDPAVARKIMAAYYLLME